MEPLRKQYCVKNTDGSPILKDGQRLLPIMPVIVVPSECFEQKWPLYTYYELNVLTSQIEIRLNVVFDRLVAQYFKSHNPIVRFMAKIIIRQKRKMLLSV